MSNGGAQFMTFGPFWDAANGTMYQSINLHAYDAGGFSTPKTFWTQEDKVAGNVTTIQGGTDGRVSAYFDGDYAIEILQSDDSTPLAPTFRADDIKITSDTATMWEGNFGTSTPAAAAIAKGHMFVKFDGSANPVALQVSNGSAFTSFIEITAGGDSVLDNLATKIMPVANVKHPDYGAIGDGSTDDTTAIQAAIDAIEAEGGGIVWLPEGTYKTTSKLVIDSSNVTLQGCNQGASIIKITHASADILELGDGSSTTSNVIIRDIKFDADAGTPRSGGSAINLYKVSNAYIQNVRIDSQWKGIKTTAANATVGIRDLDVRNTVAATGIAVHLTQGTNYWIDGMVSDNTAASEPAAAIQLEAVSNVFISRCNLTHSVIGINIEPGAGETANIVFITDCKSNLNTNDGIRVNAVTATSTVKNISISGCLLTDNTENGLKLQGDSSATLDGVSINNCKIISNVKNGVSIARGINAEVENCTISGNDSGDTDGFNGISVGAGITLFKIIGNTVGQTGGVGDTQNLGIDIAAGASDEFMIVGNSIVNNKNGTISDASTGDTKLIEANLYDVVPPTTLVTLTAATTLALPLSGDFFAVDGSTTVTGISGGWVGRKITIVFAAASTWNINQSAAIYLSAGVHWTTGEANDTLELAYDGTAWYETSRSANHV